MLFMGVKYPNINAKLKAMYAKRITKEDLDYIIKQSSLKNAVMLLKAKLEIFKDVDDNIDRLEIASILERSQIIEIKKIANLLNKNDKNLFKNFLVQYKVRCIKSIFRKLSTEDKTNDIVVQNVRMWTENLFEDISGIENVQSFDEFFSAVKKMNYNEILKIYGKKENINLFEIENKIDKYYLEKIYDKSRNINNLKKIIGSEIDLLNILWIYRIKKYYNFEKENIKNILIDRYYMLNYNLINKLLDANSFEDIKNILQNTIYKDIFKDEENIENNIDIFLYSINKKIFEEDITSSAFIYAYFNVVEYENDDIINIIEGIRYNMDKQEIKRRMVR